jgi:hypothetical protein
MDTEATGEEPDETDEREEAARQDGRHGGAGDTPLRERSPAEDEERIQDEVEAHRDGHQDHRGDCVADAVEKRGHDERAEHQRDARVDDLQVACRGTDQLALGSHQRQDRPGDEEADQGEHDREDGGETDHLTRGEVCLFGAPGAGVLGDEGRPGDGHAASDRKDEEDQWPGEGECRDLDLSEPSEPEPVDEVVQRLEEVGEHHRPRQPKKRSDDRAVRQ